MYVPGDTLENVKRSYTSKQQSMDKQRRSMDETEKEMNSKIMLIDASQAELKVGNVTIIEVKVMRFLCVIKKFNSRRITGLPAIQDCPELYRKTHQSYRAKIMIAL